MSISARYMLDRRARAVAVEGPDSSARAQSLGHLVREIGTGPFTLDQVRQVWKDGGPGFHGSATPSLRIHAFIKNGYFQEVQ